MILVCKESILTICGVIGIGYGGDFDIGVGRGHGAGLFASRQLGLGNDQDILGGVGELL